MTSLQVPVLDMSGKQVGTLDLPADIFAAKINKGLMHQAFVRQMANARAGTHSVQRRAEVSRSTKKLGNQKGGGRARHGSRSATQFVGGGRPMGPKPRDYSVDMPKQMRRAAIRSALSALLEDGQLVFVDKLTLAAPKTSQMAQIVKSVVGADTSALVLIADNTVPEQVNVKLSTTNLDNAKPLVVSYLNIRDLLQYDKVIVPVEALETIKRIWGKPDAAESEE